MCSLRNKIRLLSKVYLPLTRQVKKTSQPVPAARGLHRPKGNECQASTTRKARAAISEPTATIHTTAHITVPPPPPPSGGFLVDGAFLPSLITAATARAAAAIRAFPAVVICVSPPCIQSILFETACPTEDACSPPANKFPGKITAQGRGQSRDPEKLRRR